MWFGDILQVLFSRLRCSMARSPWKRNSPVGFSFAPCSHQISSCKIPPVCCLHNYAFVPVLVKQRGIVFPLPGWGQRIPGKIKRARGLWRTFGRGDNGAAQGGSSSTQKICSQCFQTRILGMTCPSVWSKAQVWVSGLERRELCLRAGKRHTRARLFLLPLRTSLWFSRGTQIPGFSRLLETSEVWRKPPKTPPVPAQSCVDATGWLAGSVYFLHRCGNLGKYKSVCWKPGLK